MIIDAMRPSTKFAKENLKGEIICVEVGVKSGTNALSMMKELNIKHLYLVDPYIPYEGRYQPMIDENKKKMEEKVLKPYKNKTILILKKSKDAIDDIPNEVDFLYIDSDHRYDTTKFEVNEYYKKVRRGGILGGHDYDSPLYKGVKRAVDEFVKNNKLKLYTKYSEFPTIRKGAYDWWVIKP